MNRILKLWDPYRNLGRDVYVLAFSRFVNSLGALVFPFMTLIMKDKVGLADDRIGLLVALAGALAIPSSLLGGYLSDALGRKKLIIFFNSIGLILYLMCAFITPSMKMVYLLMIIQITFSISGPAHESLVGDITDERTRPGAYALLYLAYNLGFAIAMLFAGELFAHHFRWMFIIDVLTAFLSLMMVALLIKDRYDPEASRRLAHVNHATKEANHESYELGSIFTVLWKRKTLLIFAFALLGYRFIYSQWNFLLPLHAKARFGTGIGSKLYGRLGTINALIVVTMTPLITSLVKDIRTLRRILLAGVLFLLGFGILGFIDTKMVFMVGIAVMTLGEIVEAISVMPYIMNHTPVSHRGRMSSVIPLIMGIGWTLGPMVMGKITKNHSYPFGWRVVSVILFISMSIIFWLERQEIKKGEIS